MWTLFSLLHPEVAACCKKTPFLSHKPHFVMQPHQRTRVCNYHNEMKIATDDAKSSHLELHRLCGSPAGCSYSFCTEGKCKTSKVFDSYHDLNRARLCCGEDGEVAERRECVKLLCDECGLKEMVEVGCVKSKNGVGVEVDDDMFVTKVNDWSAAAHAGVAVGWRVVAAEQSDGPSATPVLSVSTKTALKYQTGRRKDDSRGVQGAAPGAGAVPDTNVQAGVRSMPIDAEYIGGGRLPFLRRTGAESYTPIVLSRRRGDDDEDGQAPQVRDLGESSILDPPHQAQRRFRPAQLRRASAG